MTKYKKIKDSEIAKLSYSDRQIIYNGAMKLAQGFLSHPSTYPSAITLNGRLALLEAEYPWLISLAARMAKSAHLLEASSISLETTDEEAGNVEIPDGTYHICMNEQGTLDKTVSIKKITEVDSGGNETTKVTITENGNPLESGNYIIGENMLKIQYVIRVTDGVVTSAIDAENLQSE